MTDETNTYNPDAWKSSATMTSGNTGLTRNNGTFEGDEILGSLKFPNGMFVYREMMDNDPTVGAMMFAIQQLMRTVKFSAKSFDDSEQAQEYASHLESCLGDCEKPFHDYVSEFMTMLGFGFSINAIEFKKRVGPGNHDPKYKSKYKDGRYGFKGFPTRSQESIIGWQYRDKEDSQRLTHAIQKSHDVYNVGNTDLDMTRFMLFRVDTRKDNPESRSILRNAHQPFFYKKHYERDQSIRISRDARGLPVFEVPPEWMSAMALPGEKALYTNLRRTAMNMHEGKQKAVFLPKVKDLNGDDMVTLKYLNSEGKADYDVEAIIGRLTKEILQTVLADFIEMGNTSVGSFALSSNKTKMFSMAVSGWLDEISNTFQQAIYKLGVLEGWDLAKLPTLAYTDIESVDLDVYGTFLEKMTKAGVIIPDELLEETVRKEAGLPSADGEKRDVGMIKTNKEKVEKQEEVSKKQEASAAKAITASPSSKSNLK